MTLDEFIQKLLPGAQQAQAQYGIPASVTIAQAIEESWKGSGVSGLASQYNNLFGIKGAGVTLPTTEVVKGKTVHVMASFRTYDSWADSIADRSQVLMNTKKADGSYRYRGLIGESAADFAEGLEQSGYATNPQYGENLTKIMNKYGLTKYDTGSTGGESVAGNAPATSSSNGGATQVGFWSDFWDAQKWWWTSGQSMSGALGPQGNDGKEQATDDPSGWVYFVHGNAVFPDIKVHKSTLVILGLFVVGAILLFMFLKNMAKTPEVAVVQSA